MLEQHQRQSLAQRFIAACLQWIDWLLTLLRAPAQAVETLLVGIIGVWALVFFFNPTLFDISPLYGPMAEKGNPATWGRKALFMVVVWGVAVRSHNATLRYGAQILLIGWYSYLTGLFASTGVISFGAGLHALGLCYAIWVLWRFAGRKSDTP